MNALTETLQQPLPLVVDLGAGHFAWVEKGRGFTIDTRASGTWLPLEEAWGIGGTVLQAAAVAELVLNHGRPE